MAKTRTWICTRCGARRSRPIGWWIVTCLNKTMPCYGQPMELGDTVGKWKRTSRCQNCGIRWDTEALGEIHDFWGRVSPGEPMPSGECPDCGALCQPCT